MAFGLDTTIRSTSNLFDFPPLQPSSNQLVYSEMGTPKICCAVLLLCMAFMHTRCESSALLNHPKNATSESGQLAFDGDKAHLNDYNMGPISVMVESTPEPCAIPPCRTHSDRCLLYTSPSPRDA